MDDQRRELTGGWVAISDGYVVGIGAGTEVFASGSKFS